MNTSGRARVAIGAEGVASMPKAFCILGMAVSALLVILFGLDLAIGVPFSGRSSSMDIGFLVSSGILAYLSWSTFREQV